MLNAAALFDQREMDALVPEVYARFRPMVADALRFFMERLSAGRLESILAGQAALPAAASLSTRIVHFMHQCPALHKLGQVIARHRELEPGFRRDLQRLESMEPRTRVDEIRPMIQRELGGRLMEFDIQLADEALAEGSVAEVLPITWCRPGTEGRRRGVLKVIKPDAAQRLGEDLDIAEKLSDHLDRVGGDLPSPAYREIFDEVRQLLTHEIDLEQEQRHLKAASRQFAGEPELIVPRLLPFCAPGVTAMQYIEGSKVTDLPCGTGACQRRLAAIMARALVGWAVFSREEEALFHADPHAGNLLAVPGGRLGIIDWSLAGTLTRPQRRMLVQIAAGALILDEQRVARSIERLAGAGGPSGLIAQLATPALEEVRRGEAPTVRWVMNLLDGMARQGVRFPADLLLFRKAYFTLEGVLGDVCPACSLPRMLAGIGAARFAMEWPRRAAAMLDDRDFDTHLSNWDLLRIGALVPFTVGHWWMHAMRTWTGAWQTACGT